MAPERPRGEQSGNEPGNGVSATPPSAAREIGSTPPAADARSDETPVPCAVPRPPAPEPPAADTAFMEQVLLELSTQNEHARHGGGGEPGASEERPVQGSTPARTRTVRVERDSEFRTPEGVPSARAYLASKTVAPGRSAPVEADRVRLEDPRRLPTVRLPRERRTTGPKNAPGRAPKPASTPEHLDWTTPVPDETAPTLRSASPALMPPRPSQSRRWIGLVVAVALVGALIVAAVRFRASTPGASPPSGSSGAPLPHRSAAVLPRPTVPPVPSSPASDPASTGAPAPSTGSAEPSTSADPSTHPPATPKSDRWF